MKSVFDDRDWRPPADGARIGGTAYITGRNEFYFDPEDPLRRGFILR
jgi:proline racemase